MKYKPTIGIEIHAELNTKTKMFCNSKNDPDEARPNVNICPVCMAHPGTLPVINKEAVRHVLRVGSAVGGTLADYTEFDRKNYFYPDLPKGYQISQFEYPLVSGGELNGVELTRIHLEEDTGRSQHEKGDSSFVDFNRAGVPLMELVTEPVVHSGLDASNFARELQLLLRYLEASEANMEKGQMRVEANISVSDTEKLGTKVEVKNLNSFKSVERAIAYEIKRQAKLLDQGDVVMQETRGWDENKGKTFSQRIKEESHDYRYFPDPDLPSLKLSEIPEFTEGQIKITLPELPRERRERFMREFDLDQKVTELFITNQPLNTFFESVAKILADNTDKIKLASNYITSDLVFLLKEESIETKEISLSPEMFARLITMIHGGTISSRGAKDTLAYMYKEGGDPEKIAKEKDLLQKSDTGELQRIVEKIIEENRDVAEEYKNGKEASLKFLIGQGMRETKGAANPKVLSDLIKEALK